MPARILSVMLLPDQDESSASTPARLDVCTVCSMTCCLVDELYTQYMPNRELASTTFVLQSKLVAMS